MVKQFSAIGVSGRTVAAIIRRYAEFGTVEDLPRSNWSLKKATKKVKGSIRRMFDCHDKVSVRAAAAKLNISKSLVSKIKV